MADRAPWAHLARRFAGSLRARPLTTAERSWVSARLLEGEAQLFDRMSSPDRRHALGVARAVEADLGPAATRPVLAAALLHDVGKIESDLGTPARVVVTLVGRAGGYRWASRWATRGGAVGRVGRYLCHDEVGAGLLTRAGSDPLTVAWARGHHRGTGEVPERIAAALRAAD